jgi:hypothetical protein
VKQHTAPCFLWPRNQHCRAGAGDVFLIKTDEQGNEEWIKTYSGLGTALGTSVHQTVDKGYIITGSSLLSSINNSSFFRVPT